MAHAPHPAPDHAADDTSRGTRTLRLVRLRLALALIAAAVLPLAIVAPALRLLGDDTRAATTARLTDAATDVAAAVATALDTVRRDLRTIAGVEGDGDTHAEDRARATAALVHDLRIDSPFVGGVWLVDDTGELSPVDATGVAPASSVLTVAEVARLRALAPGAVAVLGPLAPDRAAMFRASALGVGVELVGEAPGEDVVLLVTRIAADPEPRALAATVSLDSLVDGAVPVSMPGSTDVAIRPPSRDPIAVHGSGVDVAGLTGEVLGRAIDPAAGVAAHAEAQLSAPGFGGWSVVLRAPLAVTSVPVEAVAILALVCLALVLLIGWMARQVLQPAAELEASRHRLRALYDTEREASLRDHLTGLGNHRAFQEELARQFDQTGRYHVPMAVVLLDLDEFKQVNDTLGHAVGDDLLAEVGRVMRATLRAADRAFRTGGDEFAIVLPHTDAQGGLDLGQRLLRRLLEERAGGTYRKPISFSAGVAAAPVHGTDRLQLLARADAALYRSKRNGRTMVTLFDAALDRPTLDEHERATLSARVAAVATNRGLKAVYQPIVHLESGRPIAFEGLVRPAPESGFESPGALFAAAEASGRTTDLDRACLDVVVAGAREIPDDAYLSVNVSPRTFEAPEFSANAFLSILHRHGFPPRRVILELTEREAIEDLDRLRTALDTCRRAGVQIAADDVGAGNAGIRLLSQIQFDVMKIDLSLVQAGSGREPVAAVLSSLVDLARRWRALVVAEGVETQAQLDMIRGLGIEAAQGYLLGRPGPLAPRPVLQPERSASDGASVWWLGGQPAPSAS